MVVLCVVALLGGGCKKKGPGPLDGSDLDTAGSGMGEGGLGGRGSMARAQRGEMPEEDGILKDVHFGYDAADLDARAFTLDVALMRALGGGFTDPFPPRAVAAPQGVPNG